MFTLNKRLTDNFLKLDFKFDDNNLLQQWYINLGLGENECFLLYTFYVLKRIMRNQELPSIIPPNFIDNFIAKKGITFMVYHYMKYFLEIKLHFVPIRIIKIGRAHV